MIDYNNKLSVFQFDLLIFLSSSMAMVGKHVKLSIVFVTEYMTINDERYYTKKKDIHQYHCIIARIQI